MIVTVYFVDIGMVRYLEVEDYAPNVEGYLQLFLYDGTMVWVNLDRVASFHVENDEMIDEDEYNEEIDGELN